MDARMIETAKKVFESFDKDHSGTTTKKEIKPLLIKISKQLGLDCPSDKDIEEGFKQLDDNNDNVLQFSEFIPFYKQIYENLIQ